MADTNKPTDTTNQPNQTIQQEQARAEFDKNRKPEEGQTGEKSAIGGQAGQNPTGQTGQSPTGQSEKTDATGSASQSSGSDQTNR